MQVDLKLLALAAGAAALAAVLHQLSALPPPWGPIATAALVMLAGAFPAYFKMGGRS